MAGGRSHTTRERPEKQTGTIQLSRIVLVSPVRDEEATLERTIECIRSQTLPPAQWIVVDDGSRDATPRILEEAACKIPWLKVVSRGDRGYRRVGAGVIEAFNEGLEAIDVPYDFIGKMDVDLEFSHRYLERLIEHFEADPVLAAASGRVYRREGGGLVEEFMIDEMVAGQFKLYRREVFEAIGGFVPAVMWDGIDFHRARMAGYRTACLPGPELRIIHLRLMGSSEVNVLRGRMRHGRGQWFMGTAAPYMLASGLFRCRERPYVVGGLAMIMGYLQAALRREPRLEDAAFRRELRRWQYRRLGRLLRRGTAR